MPLKISTAEAWPKIFGRNNRALKAGEWLDCPIATLAIGSVAPWANSAAIPGLSSQHESDFDQIKKGSH